MVDFSKLSAQNKARDIIGNFSEDQLQAFIYKHYWNRLTDYRRLLFAVPNGGNRDGREANKLKSTGVVSGIPDLVFFDCGLVIFFELKREKGVLSSNQIIQKIIINEKGVPYFIVRTPDQFFYGLIITLMERSDLTLNEATELFHAVQDKEGLIFFGLSEEDFKFEARVFEYIFKMEFDKPQDIEILTKAETREQFKKTIKKFIHLEFDRSNGFQITFNESFTNFVKIQVI